MTQLTSSLTNSLRSKDWRNLAKETGLVIQIHYWNICLSQSRLSTAIHSNKRSSSFSLESDRFNWVAWIPVWSSNTWLCFNNSKFQTTLAGELNSLSLIFIHSSSSLTQTPAFASLTDYAANRLCTFSGNPDRLWSQNWRTPTVFLSLILIDRSSWNRLWSFVLSKLHL